jgi:Fe-S oxidoreductase
MSLATADVIGVLSDNLRLRGSVVPISRRASTRWARGLALPRGGATVIYTGQMYQLMPYLERLATAERRLADSPLARFSGLGRRVNRVLDVSRFLSLPPRAAERARYEKVLVDIVLTLRTNAIDVGYLYGDDLYTGALVHDFGGDDEVLRIQAKRILDRFRKHGVRDVITVDPHTTNMLRAVLPGLVDGFDVRVRSYLEVLAHARPRVRRDLTAEVAVHDSCVYARYEDVVDQPRQLLRTAGMAVREPENSGILTWCCGGPAETLHPEKAEATARARVEQLREVAPAGVTMCPICLVNLQKAAGDTMRFTDISHYLRTAYGA